MGNSRITAEFLHDSSGLFASAHTSLRNMKKSLGSNGEDREHLSGHLNQLFRDIHSIKSESSFLDMDTLTRQANDLETLLDAVRKGKERLSLSLVDEIKNTIDGMHLLVKDLEEAPAEKEEHEITTTRQPETEYLPFFNEFEISLMEEARERGEGLYRLVCEIDNAEAMKYPRIFLIINNLELLVNVIKVEPAIEKIEKDNIGEVVIYFSSSVSEKEIYNAVNVDQVKKVHLVSLRYASIFAGEGTASRGDVKESITPSSPYTRIETEKLDELLGYVDELQFTTHRLNKTFNSFMELNTRKEFENLLHTVSAMEELLKSVRLLPLSLAFERLEHLVRDVTDKTGKKAKFTSSGGEIEIDRRLLDLLTDPLVHLVRNSVDHGIELAEVRSGSNKDEEGRIDVSAEIEAGNLVLKISDDGRGIDLEAIEDKLKEEGKDFVLHDNEDLLNIISQPGFSTLPEATDISGRGVGLDLVVQKVKEISGSEIHVQSVFGKGTVFTLIIPRGYTLLNILLVRTGNVTLAIPKRGVVESYSLQKDLYSRDQDGLLLYNGLPVFTVQGRVLMKEKLPLENFGVTIQHLNELGCLLLDELLFEKQLSEDQLVLGEELSPHLYAAYMNKRKMDFYYLNTAIIA